MHTPQHATTNDPAADAAIILTDSDARAVDAWLAAHAGGTHAPQTPRIEQLLALLRSSARADRALVDVTLARVYRARADAARHEPHLSSDDLEALDALALAGHEPAGVSASLRARAQRLSDLGAALAGSGGEGVPTSGGGGSLADRTLARIHAHIEAQRDALRLDSRPRKGGGRLRWADLISVAAMVAIGSAVLMPVVSAARDRNQRTICNANLGQTAVALSTYAGANRDALPMAVAGLGSTPWWDVDPEQPHSNSSNLYTLAREGYLRLASLACPGNPIAPVSQPQTDARDWRRLEEVSYSYQVMFGQSRPAWNTPQRTVVLADRSPVILAAVRHEVVDPLSNAPNHQYRGQHMLWTDGSVQWATAPVLRNGDNIWLPRPIERALDTLAGKPMPLEGRETPAPNDVFLGP